MIAHQPARRIVIGSRSATCPQVRSSSHACTELSHASNSPNTARRGRRLRCLGRLRWGFHSLTSILQPCGGFGNHPQREASLQMALRAASSVGPNLLLSC